MLVNEVGNRTLFSAYLHESELSLINYNLILMRLSKDPL